MESKEHFDTRSKVRSNNNNDDESNLTLDELLTKANGLLNTDSASDSASDCDDNVSKAIEILENLQDKIHSASIFSPNESLTEISTSSLNLISIEYHLAKAYIQLPFQNSTTRFQNVNKAIELFHLFLGRCHLYQSPFLLEETVFQNYSNLLAIHEEAHSKHCHEAHHEGEAHNSTNSTNSTYSYSIPPQSRHDKIQQFKLSKSISSNISSYKAKLNQRQRLSLSQDDELDGYDQDSLLRILTIQQLNYYGCDAITEIYSISLELQMLEMAMKFEQQKMHEQQYKHGNTHSNTANQSRQSQSHGHHPQQPPQSQKPLTLTHITQNPLTNQLHIQKETISKSIFRPSWNQPTMTLSQLAEKEIQEATQRSIQQKVAEEENKYKPRRYEYLVRDGLEDNEKLVDESAKVDRDWDDWKDENPRGSGNKMGDVGDRNF